MAGSFDYDNRGVESSWAVMRMESRCPQYELLCEVEECDVDYDALLISRQQSDPENLLY